MFAVSALISERHMLRPDYDRGRSTPTDIPVYIAIDILGRKKEFSCKPEALERYRHCASIICSMMRARPGKT